MSETATAAAVRGLAELVGNTPMVELGADPAFPDVTIRIKLEGENPGGSSKDRIALSMIREAERSGALADGARIVESTSGNTGIGLAILGAATGHPVTLVVSSLVSVEKRRILQALGATLVDADWTAPPGSPDNAREVAARIAQKEPNAWEPRQYENPANPDAHYTTTGPEIWQQTAGAVTHLVATIGTGGTISGTSRFLREASGDRIRVIGADPQGSTYAGGVAGTVIVDGVGSRWDRERWPLTYRPDLVDEFQTIDDVVVYQTLRQVAADYGLVLGPSGALAVAAARAVAASAPAGSLIVVIAPDRGVNYLSKTFDDVWLNENGVQL